MKRNRARQVLLSFAFLSVFAAGAATYDVYTWQGGSGSFTNSANWSPAIENGPGSGYPESAANVNQIAKFPRSESDVTVTLPSGVVTNVASPQFYAQCGASLEIDGSNTRWVMPHLAPDGAYSDIGFYTGLRNASGQSIDGKAFLRRPAPGLGMCDTTNAIGSFANFKVKLESETPSVAGTRLTFSGDLDWTGGSVLMHHGKSVGSKAEIVFKDGTMKSFPNMYVNFANATNIVTFDNFKSRLSIVDSRIWEGDYIGNDIPGIYEINLINSSVLTNNHAWQDTFNLSMGYGYANPNWYAYSYNKIMRLNVKDGSTLKPNSLDMNRMGRIEFNVTGPGARVEITHTTHNNRFSTSSCATSHVAVTDGAYLSCSGLLSFGGSTESAAASTYANVLFSNATIRLRRRLLLGHGALTLSERTEVTLYDGEADAWLCGAGLAAYPSRLVADDAVIKFTNTGVSSNLFGFSTAELGSKGLTLSQEAKKVVTIPQNFSDLDDNGGVLRLRTKAGYPLVLSGGDSRQSNLVIESGTVCLAEGANHYTHLTVTNGAEFTLVDSGTVKAASSMRLRALTLGDEESTGVLCLDPDDVVTVDGPISFVNASIRYSSDLDAGVHTVFRSTVEPSEELAELWEICGTVYITSGLSSEQYNLPKVVKEGDEWLFQIDVARTRPEMSENAEWSGASGNWDAPQLWSGGVVPTETNAASFATGGAGSTAVAVTSTVTAAGLSFASSGTFEVSGGKIVVSDALGAAIDVDSGDVTIDSKVRLVATTPITVAGGASLTFKDKVYGRGFEKTEPGRLTLESVESYFAEGFTLDGGWLTATTPSALGCRDGMLPAVLKSGTLEFTGAGRTPVEASVAGPVVVNAQADAAMGLADGTGGALLKRGAGKMVFEADKDVSLVFDGSGFYDSSDEVTYPADGSAPENPGGIAVAEGEFVLRGTSAERPDVKVTSGNVIVGIPTHSYSGETPADPTLVLDNAYLDPGENIQLGCYLNGANTFAGEARLIVTNGASAYVENAFVASRSTNIVTSMFVDNGVLSGGFDLNASANASVTSRYVAVNGSYFRDGLYVVHGSVEMAFTDSYMVRRADNDTPRSQWLPTSITVYALPSASSMKMSFSEGSIFGCGDLHFSAPHLYQTRPFEIVFDDAEWWPGTQASHVIGSQSLSLKMFTRGDGLILRPDEGQTFRVYTKVEGDGGLVKKGAGTVVFDCEYNNSKQYTPERVTLAYTGLTDVDEGVLVITNGALSAFSGREFRVAGTLDLDGAAVANAVITAAGGTIRKATLTRPVFRMERDADGQLKPLTLDLAGGLGTEGRVKFDFGVTSGRFCEPGTQLTVAYWTGSAAPDVSTWRAVNVGEGMKGSFTANGDGSVSMLADLKGGLVLVVR